jgi:hypothetical protein
MPEKVGCIPWARTVALVAAFIAPKLKSTTVCFQIILRVRVVKATQWPELAAAAEVCTAQVRPF